MNELELIKDTLSAELKNSQNYERLIRQSASNMANWLILQPVLKTLNSKIEKLKEKHRLRSNYKKALNSSVIELLKMLDDPNLNEDNVLIIEKLIILSLTKGAKSSEDLIAHEYLKIAKTLSGSEIVLLHAAFEKLNEGKSKDNLDIDDVYHDLAKSSGLRFNELVIKNYQSLMEKKLFKTPWNRENSQIGNDNGKYVFTDLGHSFLEYLEQYDGIKGL